MQNALGPLLEAVMTERRQFCDAWVEDRRRNLERTRTRQKTAPAGQSGASQTAGFLKLVATETFGSFGPATPTRRNPKATAPRWRARGRRRGRQRSQRNYQVHWNYCRSQNELRKYPIPWL